MKASGLLRSKATSIWSSETLAGLFCAAIFPAVSPDFTTIFWPSGDVALAAGAACGAGGWVTGAGLGAGGLDGRGGAGAAATGGGAAGGKLATGGGAGREITGGAGAAMGGAVA